MFYRECARLLEGLTVDGAFIWLEKMRESGSLDIRNRLRVKKLRHLKKSINQYKFECVSKYSALTTGLECWPNLNEEFRINLVINQVKKIIKNQLEENPGIIIDCVNKLVENVAEYTDIEIVCDSENSAFLKNNISKINGSNLRKISVREDELFSACSLVIKADKSVIDAKMENQFQIIKEYLKLN